MARVRINGKYSTVLKQQQLELAWTVRLATSENPKFGLTTIEIFPGTSDSQCFGTLYTLCDFASEDFTRTTAFQAKQVCSAESLDTNASIFRVVAPDRQPTLLVYVTGWGSGGISSEIKLWPFKSDKEACRELKDVVEPPVPKAAVKEDMLLLWEPK